jgi:hypothetical protein
MTVPQLRLKVGDVPTELVGRTTSEQLIELYLENGEIDYLVAKVIHPFSSVQAWFVTLLVDEIDVPPPKILSMHDCSTLSSAVIDFYATAPDELEDSEWEQVLAYRQTHDIVFAFRGCQVSSFCIGIWNTRLTASWPEGLEIPNVLNGAEISLSKLASDIRLLKT